MEKSLPSPGQGPGKRQFYKTQNLQTLTALPHGRKCGPARSSVTARGGEPLSGCNEASTSNSPAGWAVSKKADWERELSPSSSGNELTRPDVTRPPSPAARAVSLDAHLCPTEPGTFPPSLQGVSRGTPGNLNVHPVFLRVQRPWKSAETDLHSSQSQDAMPTTSRRK